MARKKRDIPTKIPRLHRVSSDVFAEVIKNQIMQDVVEGRIDPKRTHEYGDLDAQVDANYYGQTYLAIRAGRPWEVWGAEEVYAGPRYDEIYERQGPHGDYMNWSTELVNDVVPEIDRWIRSPGFRNIPYNVGGR